MVRSSFVALGALVFPHCSVADDCIGITECGGCATKTTLGVHKCHWCDIDLKCHAVGSAVSACAPSLENDHCVSNAALSPCTKSECTVGAEVFPRHVHLALAGPTGMRVMWKTNGPTDHCSVVMEDLGVTVPAEIENRRNYLEGHGYHNVATLTDLIPGSDYSYHVDCEGYTSDTVSFHVPATDRSEAKFLWVGDMGTLTKGAGLSRERLRALKDSTDLTVHVGDIGYADDAFLHPEKGCSLGFCYEAINDMYMEWMEDHFNDKPYMVCPGNHESECHSPACIASENLKQSLRNFSAYNARWAMPSPESGGNTNMWYSFDYGPVHFISANTETDFDGATSEKWGDGGFEIGLRAGSFGPEGEYLRWLEADLAAANANRAERPWIVAFGHRTWFRANHIIKDKNSMKVHKPLFEKYGVDLYMAGHVHAYSRHSPPAGSGGVPVVVTGAGGCDEPLEGGPLGPGVADDGFTYYANGDVFQVGTMDASREALTWKAINSETGEVFDTFTLTKQVAV